MEQSTMVRFPEDAVILQQGSISTEMYKIISGKVAIYFNYGMEAEYLVGILSEQRCFGEISLLCGQPSIYTVVVVEEVLLLRITEADFGDFVKNNHNNAIDIMKNLAEGLVTLSFNLNQLAEEFAGSDAGKINPQQMSGMLDRIKRYTTMDSSGAAFFTMRL